MKFKTRRFQRANGEVKKFYRSLGFKNLIEFEEQATTEQKERAKKIHQETK